MMIRMKKKAVDNGHNEQKLIRKKTGKLSGKF